MNGVVHTYYYAGGKLLRETYGSNVLDFFYHADGTPYAMLANGTYYLYITNLQGDVIGIINYDEDTVDAQYVYDAYGNLVWSTGSMASTNPLRYRGYYYDSETGLYYLQSRYYDPKVGRFLNADVYISTGQGLLGNNMFAYCLNNPASRTDLSGNASFSVAEEDDGNPMNDLGYFPEGSSSSGTWGSFIRTLQSAMDGLNMAMGQRNLSHSENHHLYSDKNKTYSPQYKEIADRYDYSLNQQENIVPLQGHKGRHTNAYHDFMLYGLTELDTIAAGDRGMFMYGINIIRQLIVDNPGLPYAKYK